MLEIYGKHGNDENHENPGSLNIGSPKPRFRETPDRKENRFPHQGQFVEFLEENSGRKFEKSGELSFSNFSDLTKGGGRRGTGRRAAPLFHVFPSRERRKVVREVKHSKTKRPQGGSGTEPKPETEPEPFSQPGRDKKSMAMAMLKRTFVRTIPDNFERTAHENVGFRGKEGQKVHPNFAPNITMLFALPCSFLS